MNSRNESTVCKHNLCVVPLSLGVIYSLRYARSLLSCAVSLLGCAMILVVVQCVEPFYAQFVCCSIILRKTAS